MFKIEENKILKDLTTMKMGGAVKYFISMDDKEDLLAISDFIEGKNLPFFVIGGGSNIVPDDRGLEMICIAPRIHFTETIKDTEEYAILKIGAGNTWDKVVEYAIDTNLHGVESLSLIPGSFGGAIVQNIGAYGAEISDLVQEVEAYDFETKSFVKFTKEQCKFAYRASIFKNQQPFRYLVVNARLKLLKRGKVQVPNYAGVAEALKKLNKEPTLAQIRQVIINIRNSKLPDYKSIPNCGSFFVSPIIAKDQFKVLKSEYPEIPTYPDPQGYKIPAGWLIQRAGLKGKAFGNIVISPKHALVLTNPDQKASFLNLNEAIEAITKVVRDKFGIPLKTEVVMVSKRPDRTK